MTGRAAQQLANALAMARTLTLAFTGFYALTRIALESLTSSRADYYSVRRGAAQQQQPLGRAKGRWPALGQLGATCNLGATLGSSAPREPALWRVNNYMRG